jgi:hypothetical protein
MKRLSVINDSDWIGETMGAAVDRLTGMVNAEDRYDIPHAELRDAQVEAMNERFQERKDSIKLLGHRAGEGGIDEVRGFEDVVQLLFPTRPIRATLRTG